MAEDAEQPGGISFSFGTVERKRGHLVGLVRVHHAKAMLYADTVRLDVAESRRAFAEEVVTVAKGVTVSAIDIERELLAELDRAVATEEQQAEAADAADDGERKSQATILVELAAGATLFHTREREAFAYLPIGATRQTWPVVSRDFKDWLAHQFYSRMEKAPGSQAVADAQSTLRGRALFEGPTWPVFTRVAELGGRIYVDLADESWSAVEIGPGSWRVIAEPPVRFRRARGMLPLPRPVSGGSLAELRPFVNVANDADWMLLASWLVMALHPRGHPGVGQGAEGPPLAP